MNKEEPYFTDAALAYGAAGGGSVHSILTTLGFEIVAFLSISFFIGFGLLLEVISRTKQTKTE